MGTARITIEGEGFSVNRSYRDLRVWQRSMELVVAVYNQTRRFPNDELYGLVSQMRRSAVSVPSNIAEGKGRLTDRDRAHFFSQARGSLLELEAQILIAQELNYISGPVADSLLQHAAEAGRMLNSLIESIRPKAGVPGSLGQRPTGPRFEVGGPRLKSEV
ncbi:MAG: four helix bundle protein [Candidatus Sulfotelmatobacter sp.]|jgi:four helix bundle protein